MCRCFGHESPLERQCLPLSPETGSFKGLFPGTTPCTRDKLQCVFTEAVCVYGVNRSSGGKANTMSAEREEKRSEERLWNKTVQ